MRLRLVRIWSKQYNFQNGMVKSRLGLAGTVLAIIDVEQNHLGGSSYGYNGNYQLWRNRGWNGKNSRRLFQFLVCQKDKIGQTFFDSLDGFNY